MIRKVAHHLAPRWTAKVQESLWERDLVRQVRTLHARCRHVTSLDLMVDEILQHPTFRAWQKKSEIVQLLSLVQEKQPKYLCEIGAASGGSLFLFCQVAAPDARILSIDLDYTPLKQRVFSRLGRPDQRITCLTGDSRSPDTVEQVKEWLAKNTFDFLFVDGDHTLSGVSSDYDLYAPLVREGGIIALHDIVPDYRTRYGIETECDTGQVPQFWNELQPQAGRAQEFIADRNQDGFGIGVLHTIRGQDAASLARGHARLSL